MIINHNKFIVNCQKVENKRDKYNIYSEYNEEFIENIKILPKNQREYKNKYWELSTKGLYQLIKFFRGSDKIIFDFGNDNEKKIFIGKIKKIDNDEIERKRIIKELEVNKKTWLKLKQEYEINHEKYWDEVHKNLKPNIKLYPYQVVSALFLNKVKNALLALDMGLGKTISSIAYIEMNDFDKVIVITPNSLKFNFYEEVKKFTNSKAHIVNWKNNEYEIEESKYVIMNYEYFHPSDKKKMDEKFKKLNIDKIDCVICDESTRLKNSASNTFKNFKRIFNNKLFKSKPSKIFLSGTPAPNRAFELYTILNQISPIDFATKTYFYEYYCGMTYNLDGYGWETDIGSQNLEELFHKISPYIYRKRKKDVLTDLPDKIYQKIILEMNDKEKKEYEDIEMDTVNNIFQAENHPLTIMIRLRQYVSNIKILRIKEIIDDLLETGQKIVIVDMFKDILYEIQKLYPDISIVHTGDQTVEERADMVKEFQNPDSDIKIFLGSIQTCNYGLTLTAASILIILTLPFSVGEYDQVTDRCHRIGQKNVVNIYLPVFKNTIDEYVFFSVENKRKEILKVIDNEEYTSNVTESVFSDVINNLKKKYN